MLSISSLTAHQASTERHLTYTWWRLKFQCFSKTWNIEIYHMEVYGSRPWKMPVDGVGGAIQQRADEHAMHGSDITSSKNLKKKRHLHWRNPKC